MRAMIWVLFGFLAGLHCASPRTAARAELPAAGFSNISTGGGSSGETGGKRDMNQTIISRKKRKDLSVDFAVPSLLRYYLAEFVKRPLNGDCQTFSGCYSVRANLEMHCAPLQKIIATFVEPRSADSAPGNASSDGQLPFVYKRALSKVLKLGLTKASRKSNQVVVEIGEELIKTGCGGLTVYEEAPQLMLEMDLTTILEWWLGAEGGRLRVRLMPEKKAQVPGMEVRYTEAIRAADPRLYLQISSQGESPHSIPPLPPPLTCSCHVSSHPHARLSLRGCDLSSAVMNFSYTVLCCELSGQKHVSNSKVHLIFRTV
ncbi:ALK tyrosine kinase receptor [Oryzias melastigma]|uniref:ALK tyrosine kinase receptor n=1 Tax=Oryzias melastigma TaxID=30732 RepID=A0A834CKL8_ORYME|nr:ALK tyrosine kinase receptor [Oryzias melastigma]